MVESLGTTKIHVLPKYFTFDPYISIVYPNLCAYFDYFWYAGLVDSPWPVHKQVWTNMVSK